MGCDYIHLSQFLFFLEFLIASNFVFSAFIIFLKLLKRLQCTIQFMKILFSPGPSSWKSPFTSSRLGRLPSETDN